MEFTDSEVLDKDGDEIDQIETRIPLAHRAAAGGDTDALSRAIQADPSVLEHHDPEGYTPLAHAVMAEQFDSLKMLVKMGTSIDAKDKLGRTGLAMAAYQGWYDGLVFLLRNGAKTAVHDEFGRTPLHAATYPQQPRVFARLLQNLTPEKVNQQDHEGMTALHWCAFHNRPLHIELLWHKGADPFLQDVDGHTALHWAAQNGSVACCEQLLINPHGSKLVNMIDSTGKTALHLASAAGHMSVVQVLSKVPTCNLHAEDPDQRTALHWAAATGQAAVIRCLIQLQLNTNIIDVEGATPLMYAREFRHHECARILEQHLGWNESKPPAPPSGNNTVKDSQNQKPMSAFHFIMNFLQRKKPSMTLTEISDDSGATYSDSSDSCPELTPSQSTSNNRVKKNSQQSCYPEELAVTMQKLSELHEKELSEQHQKELFETDNPSPGTSDICKTQIKTILPPVHLNHRPLESPIVDLSPKDQLSSRASPCQADRKRLEQTAAVILGRDIDDESSQPSTSKASLEPLKIKKVLSEEKDTAREKQEPEARKAPLKPLAPLRGHLPASMPPDDITAFSGKKTTYQQKKKKRQQHETSFM